jgi:hypothetical protein
MQNQCIERIGGKLVVIDNSYHGNFIKDECNKLGVIYRESTARGISFGSPSSSHGAALNYAKEIIDYSSDWCLIDHDFFPTHKIDFEGFDIISIPQIREGVTYLWPGFIAARDYVNLRSIDFMPVHGVGDTGANTRIFFEEGKYKIKGVFERTIVEDIPKGVYLQMFPTLSIIDGIGIHYLNGSSWMSVETEVMIKKNNDLIEIINKLSNEDNFKSDSN